MSDKKRIGYTFLYLAVGSIIGGYLSAKYIDGLFAEQKRTCEVQQYGDIAYTRCYNVKGPIEAGDES